MTSNVINCKACGQIFISRNNQNLCPICAKMENAVFDLVRKYVRSHPGQNVWEVAEGTGVRSEIVLSMIKQGTLALVN